MISEMKRNVLDGKTTKLSSGGREETGIMQAET